MPVWAFHSADDSVVDVAHTDAMDEVGGTAGRPFTSFTAVNVVNGRQLSTVEQTVNVVYAVYGLLESALAARSFTSSESHRYRLSDRTPRRALCADSLLGAKTLT
jgi:hypothetical protein